MRRALLAPSLAGGRPLRIGLLIETWGRFRRILPRLWLMGSERCPFRRLMLDLARGRGWRLAPLRAPLLDSWRVRLRWRATRLRRGFAGLAWDSVTFIFANDRLKQVQLSDMPAKIEDLENIVDKLTGQFGSPANQQADSTGRTATFRDLSKKNEIKVVDVGGLLIVRYTLLSDAF